MKLWNNYYQRENSYERNASKLRRFNVICKPEWKNSTYLKYF